MSAVTIPLLAGPQLLGVCFNWGLLGVLSLQAYTYYDCFPQDRWPFKSLVLGTLAFEWVQTGLLTASAFDIYVYQYGDDLSLITFHNAWFSATIMDGIISAIVQIFFAWRIYRLSANTRVIAGIIVLLALVQTVACIVGGAMEKSVVVASAIRGRLLAVVIVWLSGSVVVDVLIAVSMTILLLKHKTGIPRTDALINRMVRLVVETGALTASMAILVLILANIRPLHQTLVYEAPAVVLTKIYANTLLTNLNNRASLRRYEADSTPIGMSGIQFAPELVLTPQVATGYDGSRGTGDVEVLRKVNPLGLGSGGEAKMEELEMRRMSTSGSVV